MHDFYDVAIVGGGFSGIALARDAAFHGFKTILFEAQRLGGGTSANSLRIVHGGFRYLQTGAIDRVLQSARAQAQALDRYPEFIRPLPCLMPLQKCGLKSKWPVRAALAVYNLIGAIPRDRRGAVLTTAEAEATSASLKGAVPHGALKWWDAEVANPAGLIEKIRADAIQLGAEIFAGKTVSSITIENDRVRVTSEAGGVTSIVEAKSVINAAGPGISSIDVPGATRSTVRWCRGFNLVFKCQFDPLNAIAGQGRGRLLFSVPRGSGTAVGTWYVPQLEERGAGAISVSEAEIASALDDIRAAFPSFECTRANIELIECGVLPTSSRAAEEQIPLGREIVMTSGRYTELVSTKFTTFEVQAQRILRQVASLLK